MTSKCLEPSHIFCIRSPRSLKANCQRSGYVSGIKKEKQSGCAETKFQSRRVKEDSFLMEYFFLSLYMN